MSSLRVWLVSSACAALFLACSGQAPEGEPTAVAQDEAVTATPTVVGVDGTLYQSAAGLSQCNTAESVRTLRLSGRALTTYPYKIEYLVDMSEFSSACAGSGIPVPLGIRQFQQVVVERFDLGCGSLLYRGFDAAGARLEVFDHRGARGGWRCGTPSVNPIIVRHANKLWYAPAACSTATTEAACNQRPDCRAVIVQPVVEPDVTIGQPPRPVFLRCEDPRQTGGGPEPV